MNRDDTDGALEMLPSGTTLPPGSVSHLQPSKFSELELILPTYQAVKEGSSVINSLNSDSESVYVNGGHD
jgi:hypothetical protein